ncbi:MAG: patatin-like phospholipase family protein [Acidobacteria bacterium]|nr:patatin-like phospholipase family protein [Acidobacteriota bacterium]
MKRALVLSGGGLFGAWQVGAWSVLRQHVEFDVIIGASIGALNGWAIAGGASPEDLARRWIEAARRGRLRFRLPLNPLDGLLEFSQIEGWIRELHAAFQPRMEYHAVVTDLLRLHPRMIEGRHVHWRHLAASCALIGLLPQQRIDRVLYTDGGLLGALPLWAAVRCHATHVIGLHVMPRMPLPVRAALKTLRLARTGQRKPDQNDTLILSPARPLGDWKTAMLWQRAGIEDWISQGREDAGAAVAGGNISFLECFKR